MHLQHLNRQDWKKLDDFENTFLDKNMGDDITISFLPGSYIQVNLRTILSGDSRHAILTKIQEVVTKEKAKLDREFEQL